MRAVVTTGAAGARATSCCGAFCFSGLRLRGGLASRTLKLRRRRRHERDGCFLHRGPCRLDLKRGTSAVLRSMLSAMRGGSIVNSNLYPGSYVNLLTTTGYRADTLFVLIPLTQNSG